MTTDPEPPPFEGAGIVSSYADLSTALTREHVDPAHVAFAAADAGLDTLGMVVNPLDSLFEAGVGWLIEHVEFLSEPLDALAGDPDAVLQQARAWQGISAELHATATGYRQAAAAVTAGWDGAAAEAYGLAARRCAEAMDSTSGNAARLADVVVTTGAAVGTVRALIRDAIAKFLSDVIQWVIAALAAATVTAGFSLGALVAAVVQDACSLARTFVQRISDLLDLLSEAGTTVGQLGEALRRTAQELAAATRGATDGIATTVADSPVGRTHRDVDAFVTDTADVAYGPNVRAGAEVMENTAERVHADALVEAGKQRTAAEQAQRGWPGSAE